MPSKVWLQARLGVGFGAGELQPRRHAKGTQLIQTIPHGEVESKGFDAKIDPTDRSGSDNSAEISNPIRPAKSQLRRQRQPLLNKTRASSSFPTARRTIVVGKDDRWLVASATGGPVSMIEPLARQPNVSWYCCVSEPPAAKAHQEALFTTFADQVDPELARVERVGRSRWPHFRPIWFVCSPLKM
ncbi:MAG: hypothetical protein L0219_04210 [Phycisphaerales bacterium]|nr:hypothetical protein [Phycisphaerales bacterium]MCI0675594.1 hypothetical protein [Phycisphaerales bacterium]